MKRAGAVLLVLGAASVGSCSGNEEVTLVLLDPCAADGGTSFKDASVYTEILVVKNGCPADEDLAAGKVENVEFSGIAESSSSLPEVGDLPKGKYGFVVLVKDANCGVVGFGCTAADLENIREVRIAVRAWTSADTCQPLTGGKCPAPKTCEEGRCVGEPSGDGGVGCDLTVVADGTLPSTSGASVTGPGIVATSSGFVIGYREYATDGAISATLVPLSDGGDLGTPQSIEVASCAGKTLSDGVGMAFKGSDGLFVSSLPDCSDGNGAGAAFVQFDASGTIGPWSAPHNPAFSDLTLARGHAAAPAIAAGEWEFHYRAVAGGTGSIQRGIIQGNSFKSGFSIEYPFSGVDATFGQVATGSIARGFLGGGIPLEAGTATTVKLNRIDAAAGEKLPPTIGELSLPGGSWATITAWGDKVAAGVPATSGLTWSAVTVSASSVSPIVDQATLGTGSVSSADMVAHGDSLLVALGKSGTITAYRLTGATGSLSETPEATSEVTATGFSGTQMAIAAARSRLAIAWLGSGSSTGGYALLQCSE